MKRIKARANKEKLLLPVDARAKELEHLPLEIRKFAALCGRDMVAVKKQSPEMWERFMKFYRSVR